MNSDKYKTIKEKAIGEGYYSEKRSKFLAFAHHVDSVDEALELVKEYRKKYYDARHCCYAYRVGFDGTEFCVIRYYGGINLGTGGLIVAYREAAADALANSEIEEKFIEEEVTYSFSYPMMNAVMRIIKDMNPRIISQVFDNTCEVTLSIRKGKADELRTRLKKLSFD